MKRFYWVAVLAASVCNNAWAMGPFEFYERALRNDPVYLGAIKERDAGQENRAIGRAGLLPHLGYSYNKGHNQSKVTYLNDRGASQHDDRNYSSYGSSLTLQQPLLDYEAYAAYRKGVAQALFADESFRGKSQELLVRVLSHYTQALFAQDQIDIAQAKKKAFEQQFRQNEHLFRQGEGTRTDILEAQARYELAIAEEIEARDEQDAALRELGSLIGVPALDIGDLAPLHDTFQTFALQPASFDTWHALAVSNNPSLASQRQAVDVARFEVERNRAGHLPKVSAYATMRQNESESGNTYNQRYDTNTIGLEVSVPLYAGGGVSASTRQASRTMEQAEYELEAKTRETLIELRRQFSACVSGVNKLRAYQKALSSAEALVVSTRQSILGGERVNLDALNAEQQLYSTRRDLAQARYDYLMAWTKLHYYAGTLGPQDLAKVDEAFVSRAPIQ
ncbi:MULTISPECIES: TolC family outer membrane protein [unclassified Pseudomonas]|uniref:TolC family outer membrane protein n=1 Tax=unclassified Pseudomonas TaxID=196821 RepID=UPI0008767436|nr:MULTISPECIES: TolC family outer membrane protein [unclassified Pseudomonas]SCZ23255.1 outer membrane protein, protease secretion system [Pseudomonas sp. NFACC44-2]SDA53297.1 outer membrane protein, protease secretion system [Pseudomonas sp. NFACC51]SFH25897.1 outer membrane protein, protease secretion system [Pseudomonas sp. NFACC54]SFS99898.1 outer membrane protein, protease secretion system [Pseudomonas sp. NFACC48-1]